MNAEGENVTPDNILIIDDNAESLRLLHALLSEQGYSVRVATNGTMALESARSKRPDLILLDIRMPDIDGYEVCKRLKSSDATKDVSVIFVSVGIEALDKVKAFAVGGVDYITKPYKAEEVLARVRAHLTISHLQQQLRSINEELEARIRERTADLARANESLQTEIAERTQAEESLRKTHNDLQATMNAIPDILFEVDGDGHIYNFNVRKDQLLYLSPDDFLGKTVTEVMPEEAAKIIMSAIAEAQEKGFHCGAVYSLDMPEGRQWFELSIANREGNSDGYERLIALVRDITDRIRAEEALRAERDKLKSIFETMDDGVYIVNQDYDIEYVNPVLTAEFGPPGGRKCYAYFHGREEVCLWCKNPDVFAGKTVRWEWYSGKNDRTYDLIDTPLRNADGTISKLEIFRDITERKRAEESLRESEKKFRSIIEQSNDAIYILYNDRFDLINRRFTELTGITIEETENPDFNLLDTLTSESRALVEERKRMWASGVKPPGVYEFTLIHKNGKRHHVQASVTEIDYRDVKAILGILRDISEQKVLEDQLRQAQKIESIGHLTGGIAHDFNNLLTPIIGHTELAMMKLDPSEPLYDDLREIKETAIRASELTRQLLAFSRKQVLDVKMVDLNRLIENFRKILRRTIREDVKIEIKYGSPIGLVQVDVSQIEQILLNLLVNAQDAMPAGGIITVETESVELDQEYANSHTAVTPGQYVMLAVSDTGEGMDEDTVRKIFDPFFTTKKVGKGTGLGLSMVYGIVKQHGGNIWVYSEPGKGTTFKIYLPVVEGESAKSVDSSQDIGRYHGAGTILVVEDQEQVRMIAARILRAHGYTVHVASNGDEAVSIVKDQKLSIDLLLTDVIMPNMNGPELYGLLSRIYPDLKVLYMSGYTQNVISHHGVLKEGIDFIQKPLRVEALERKVKEVLER